MGQQMKKLAAGCLIFLLLLCLTYFGLAFYYRDGFALNTWINGVYCTGRTVEEINRELLRQTAFPEEIAVKAYDTSGDQAVLREWKISLRNVDFTADYTENLQAYLAGQSPWLWVDNITFHREHALQPLFSFEEETLRECWEKWCLSVHREAEYCITYSQETGYCLRDGLHDYLDEEQAYQVFRKAIEAGQDSIDLTEANCYRDVTPTEEQEKLAALWEKIMEFQSGGPIYDFGDGEEQLSPAVMAAFLEKEEQDPFLPLMDERDCFLIAEDAVGSYVEELMKQRETQGKEWKFQSTRGDIVTVRGVTYGTVIDRKKEAEWLNAYLEAARTGGRPDDFGKPHMPEYTQEAFCRSSTTIGDTYIEVDMGIQKLYYYENGVLKLETDVVTGNARRRMNTPEGVNYVYAKQKNRVLRGEGYASPVSYWMPVKGAIGIHDANWRKEFGGTIYKTNGSHGCINVATDVMPELYDMVEIGTPVVMFYGEEPEADEKNQ